MALKLYVGVINLVERDDRFLNAQQQFAKIHPQGKVDQFLGFPVHIHRVHRHPKGGRFGCYTSHLMVMQAALDAGCNACLVLEDDFTFLAHRKAYVNSKLKVSTLPAGLVLWLIAVMEGRGEKLTNIFWSVTRGTLLLLPMRLPV